MTKKIKCNPRDTEHKRIKVRVVKAPLVDTNELRRIVACRARAIVL